MGYSYQGDNNKTAKALARREDISRRLARETCTAIKGMKVNDAITYLQKVIKQEAYVPLKRHNTKQPHRKGGQPGKYPTKSSKIIIKLLNNLKANAQNSELNTENLKIVHATAYKNRIVHRVRPRGKAKSSDIEWTTVELVGKEV